MAEKNIDGILKDRRFWMNGSGESKRVDLHKVPIVGELVMLNTIMNDCQMLVKITAISDDSEIIFGVVDSGYYPENEEEHINPGEDVYFKNIKIAGAAM